MAETETKKPSTFDLNGETIAWASMDAYLMDDWKYIWDNYVEMTPDEFIGLDRFIPGAVMAMVHMSIAKAKPALKTVVIRRQVGALTLVDLVELFDQVSEEVDDVSVPPMVAEPPSESSGDGSVPAGELSLVNNPEPGSGPPGSLTSLADFARVISANSPPGNSTAFGN